MAHLRKQDEIHNIGPYDDSEASIGQNESASHISRRDLKGIIGNESSAFESSVTSNNASRSQVSNNKVTSNIDSIYGFYKKKGAGDDDEMEEESENVHEHSRNTTNFENSSNPNNYVPANQMLDLRLLNAEINAGLGGSTN